MGIDFSTARDDLRQRRMGGLHVVTVAQTPLDASSVLIHPDTDPATNPALRQALKIYGKHYLASQEGIPGEGEEKDVVLSRLRGNDPNTKMVTVTGLADSEGTLHGVAFVETYHVHEKKPDGTDLDGLVHLVTYAATEKPYDSYEHNAAFHAGLMQTIAKVDEELGFQGKSVVTTEVNCSVDYDGKPTSNKMDGEFEIKTGVKSEKRAAYVLGGPLDILTEQGRYNNTHILQIPYTPPALAGEGAPMLEGITNASVLMPHVQNREVTEGQGEPLFLTAENVDGGPLTAEQMELQKAFQVQLVKSVMLDRGVTDHKLIVEARSMKEAGFSVMDEGYDKVAERLRDRAGSRVPLRPRDSWSQTAG